MAEIGHLFTELVFSVRWMARSALYRGQGTIKSVNMLSTEEKKEVWFRSVTLTTAPHIHSAPVQRHDSTERITCTSRRRPQNVSDLFEFCTEYYIL